MGHVSRPTLKSGAERVVKDIEGIEKVVNRVEVLPLSPNAYTTLQATCSTRPADPPSEYFPLTRNTAFANRPLFSSFALSPKRELSNVADRRIASE